VVRVFCAMNSFKNKSMKTLRSGLWSNYSLNVMSMKIKKCLPVEYQHNQVDRSPVLPTWTTRISTGKKLFQNFLKIRGKNPQTCLTIHLEVAQLKERESKSLNPRKMLVMIVTEKIRPLD
jgi:hypothetical protein